MSHVAPVRLDLHAEQVRRWLELAEHRSGVQGLKLEGSSSSSNLDIILSSNSKGDPLARMPVTSTSTGITFTNYYCAVCNNAGRDVVFWKPRLECPTLQVE